MKYRILIPLIVEADPADIAGAAQEGFQAVADLFNNGDPLCLHILPQDGSPEALTAERVLSACFTASSIPQF